MRLDVDSVQLEFGRRKILQSVSLTVNSGQIVGLLGRNGSGKSTLLKVMYGTQSATSSSVRVNGVYTRMPYKQGNLIGFLPQKPFVPAGITPALAFKMYGSDLDLALRHFPGLENSINKRFSDFSGGEVRLLETLLVITSPCSFLLLDEPFSHIMPAHVDKIKALLLVQKQEKGIVVTDHYYREILEISDQVCHLDTSGYLTRLKQPIEDLKRLGYIYTIDH